MEVTPGAAGVSASTQDTNGPAGTVDNNLATRWSGNGDGAWIRYDLGTIRRIRHVRIAVYNGNSRQNRFDLQTSIDGDNWTNALTDVLTSGATTLEETYDFADVDAQYVRYVGHMATTSTFNSLTEVSIFASLMTVPTATPSPTAATPSPTPTPAEPVDVTPGAAGVSASANDGNLPGNTVDGSLATRWSANGDGQWLQLDLGSTRSLALLKIAWHSGDARRATFDIQIGDAPGGPFTTIAAGVQSSGTTTALETYEIPDAAARHVRVLGHGNTANAWNSISEIEVWGR
jgi:poly(beta-D-mannuronate) lyase